MASGLEGFPGAYPLGFTPRRSVVDPVTGRPVVTSAPTGAVQQRASVLPVGRDDTGALVPAVPQGLFDAIDAARFPGQVLRGEKSVFDPATGHTSDEALGAATGLAGLAMTGSMPFKAPKGAIRSFGGAAADDPFAALEAGLAAGMKDIASDVRLPSRVDPGAKSWDLYHGSTGGPDFTRFDPSHGKAPGHSEGGALFLTPDPDTAGFYANGSGAGVEAGPRVFRTTVDPGRTKVFDLPEMIEADPALGERARSVYLAERGVPPSTADIASADSLREAYRTDLLASRARDREINAQLSEYGMEPTATTGATYGHGYLGAVIQMAKEQGLDTAVIRGLAEHGGGDQVVALAPGRVRSFYSPDQVLYSGGRGAGPAGAAALALPGATPTNPQEPPMSAGLGNLSPEDFAAIFGTAPPGGPVAPRRIPFGLNPAQVAPGADGSDRAPSAMPSFGLGSQMPDAPQMPPVPAPAAPERQAPAVARAMTGSPLPPPRPAELGAPAADMPVPNAVPTSGNLPNPAGAPKAEEPSFLDGLMRGIQKTDGLLGSIGIGMLTTPGGIGAGLGAGLKNYQAVQEKRAVTDLARNKALVEQQKAAREARTLTGNASYVKSIFAKQGREITDDQAMAFGSNQAVMNDIFKGTLPPMETFREETDADGNRFSVNTRTGQKTVLLQAKDDKTVAPVTEEDRVKLGLPAGSYQKDANGKVMPINPGGQTINLGGEKAQDAKVGGSYGEYQIDLATKGRNAASTLNTLAIMEQAARNPAFYSGAGAEWVKRGNQALVALGVKDANYTKPTEVFDALSNKVVLDGLGGSLGPGISNTDRDYIGRTAPTLERTQAGNIELIGIARTLAQRQQAVAKLARDYAAKNGGRVDAGFDQVLEDYASSNPLFPSAQASATAQPDAKTGASGPGGVAAPKTQAEFDALPKGAAYIDPDTGKRYRK